MKVSMNELKASLRRCFEASDYPPGHYEDAADILLWLEQHGFNGLDELKKTLPYLKQDTDKPLSSIIFEDPTSVVIDAHGRSAFNCIATAVDLAQAKAMEVGIVTVKVRHCHNRKAVIKALVDCGQRGLSAVAYWQNGEQQVTEHTAAIKANDSLPSYSQSVVLKSEKKKRHSVTIICSNRMHLVSSLKTEADVEQVSFDEQKHCKVKVINNGITIRPELWEQINRIGSEVLVPNSERSRQGAG